MQNTTEVTRLRYYLHYLCNFDADGIPKLLYNGTEGDYNVIVMELLGPNLDDLMSYCEPGLSIKSVIMIADQLVSALRG